MDPKDEGSPNNQHVPTNPSGVHQISDRCVRLSPAGSRVTRMTRHPIQSILCGIILCSIESNALSSPIRAADRPCVPLIGPFYPSTPLPIGGIQTLPTPTFLQRQTIHEAVRLHTSHTDGISAAPIVAVIDSVSSGRTCLVPGTERKGRYATLAAVVSERGVSSGRYWGDANATDWDTEPSVTLYGIGRAVLCGFYNRLPSSHTDDDDEDSNGGSYILEDTIDVYGDAYDYYADRYELHDDHDDDETDPLYPTPLIMSDFELLHDDDSVTGKGYLFLSRSSFRNHQGCQPHVIARNEFSRSSPVHAIAELHHMYNRVTWMHAERQKLVKGLRMAKIRLDNREALNNEESDFRDYVKWQEEEEADVMTVSAFLTKYGGQTANPTTGTTSTNGDGSLPTPTLTTVSDPNNLFPSLGFSMESKINDISGIERIRQLDNYGLQTYAYQTSIQTLTHDLIEKLTPFYSPTYTTREEFFYEKASFVTLRALEPYVTPKQVAKSLMGTSSLTRLTMGYELMLEHRWLLEELAREMSDALLECGEECTDLW